MLQPFKNITLEFGGKSSNGMTEVTGSKITEGGKNIDPILRELGTGMYSAVKLDGTKAGEEHTAHIATIKTEQVVGVLTEVFKQDFVGATVMTNGIVSLKAASSILPGDPVGVSASGKIAKVTTAKDKYFGVALTQGAANEYVDVLLQIGGLTV